MKANFWHSSEADMCLQNDSLQSLLARMEGILGPMPCEMRAQGRFSHRYYTRSGAIYQRQGRTVRPPA